MSDDKDPIERQQQIQAKDGAREEGPSNIGGRLFAILLLIVVTPFLLFAGYCGLAASMTVIGPILLLVFGVGAFITYKGVQALWRPYDPAAGIGWAIAFVLFAIAVGCLYGWANQPLGWYN